MINLMQRKIFLQRKILREPILVLDHNTTVRGSGSSHFTAHKADIALGKTVLPLNTYF